MTNLQMWKSRELHIPYLEVLKLENKAREIMGIERGGMYLDQVK